MNAIADICKKCKRVMPTAKDLKIIKKREKHTSWAFLTGAIVFGFSGVWIIINADFSGIFYIILAILFFSYFINSESPEYIIFYGNVISKEIRYNEAYTRFTPEYRRYDDTYSEKSEKFRYWAEYHFVNAEVNGIEIVGISCSEKEYKSMKKGDSIIIIVDKNKMQIKAYKK